MDVSMSKELIEAIGQPKLAAYGIDKEKNYYSAQTIDLRRQNTASIKKLRELIEPHKKVKGGKAIQLLSDIGIWLEAAEKGVAGVKCKNTKHFAALAHEFIQALPKHWLYCKDDDHELWAAFYVEEITFHEKEVRRDGITPARTRLDLYYIELDKYEHTPIDLEDREVKGKTVPEVLAEMGYLVETPELLAQYEKDRGRFMQFFDKLGMQFLAEGVGIDSLDGKRSYWHTDKHQMIRNGEPSRVVIDVKREDDKEEKENKSLNRTYWRSKSYLTAGEDDEPDEVEPGDEDPDDSFEEPIIPLFPVVPVFDLKRHMRLRAHMRNLTEYVYDDKLGEKLVLPQEIRAMVDMLVQHKGGFRDIIGGKGGGATILCAGPPGTGKCLAPGTPVMKFDGSIVPVEQIGKGDLLMGPDSTPRTVLSTTTGHDQMFKIIPNKGDPWVCNSVHKLTLVHSVNNEVIDVDLDVYLDEIPASTKHHLKLFQPGGITFSAQEIGKITPYFLGVWLGDGGKSPFNRVNVSKPDAEIYAACKEEAECFGLEVRVQIQRPGDCPIYHLTGGNRGGQANPLLDELRRLMKDGAEIRIPDQYRLNDFTVRKTVLAGLLDTDGHPSCGGYEILQKNGQLAEDICFVARSLGLRATMRTKIVNGQEYRRIFISGDCTFLPLRIARKLPKPRKQKKNVLRTGFRVEPVGMGQYCGFTLDGDGRFLLGDFTVTHNTLTAEIYAEVDHRALYSVQCSQLGTDPDKLEESLLKSFGRAQRWNAILLLDEADVYVAARGSDMDQNAVVGVFLRVLEYYSGVLFMTTNRADLVDDAIASRCIARLTYSIPSREDLQKIWRILCDVMGVPLTDEQIKMIVLNNPNTSGRDVKNLLKLATLISAAHNAPITPEVINYVRRFKPTEDIVKGPSPQFVKDPTP